MTLSSTLYHVLVSDIGRCCAGSFGFRASLGRSMMVASPIPSGTVWLVHMCSMSRCVISIVALPPAFSTSAHMLSGPGALSFAMFSMVFLTSVSSGASVLGWLLCPSSGGLWVEYISCQKVSNLILSSSLSMVAGLFRFRCDSLIFLIIFHQSGVVAIICSMLWRSFCFLWWCLSFLLYSAPRLSRLSRCISALCPFAVMALYFQCAILCCYLSLISWMFFSLILGACRAVFSASCMICLYSLYLSSVVL